MLVTEISISETDAGPEGTRDARADRTVKQQLIEARAGKDVRAVMADAYEASGGTIEGATAWIEANYGVSVSTGIFWHWIQDFRGVVRKALEFPT